MVRNTQFSSEKKFWCKVFEFKDDKLVAICDKEILGKKLNFKGVKVEIRERFYKGELVNEEKALDIMKKSTIGNFFGEKIVDVALKNGFITKENIIFIEGIPHAQFVKIL